MVITLLPGWKGILKGSGLRAAGPAVLGLTYFGLGHCAVSSLSQPARRVLPRQALTEATVHQRNVRKRVHPKSSFSTVRCMHGPSSLSSAHHFLLSQRFVTRACVSCTAPAGTGAGTPLAHVICRSGPRSGATFAKSQSTASTYSEAMNNDTGYLVNQNI